MIRAGVLGPGDVAKLAPWCRLPVLGYREHFSVLYVVVMPSGSITVERYRFERRDTDGIPSMALQDVVLHSERNPAGEQASRSLYWPPVDVVQAAVLAARGAR